MEKSDFQIGCEFYTASGKWRCTDIGSRVIVAIKLDGKHDDPSWYEPPYLVEEVVFDEHDLGGCDLEDRFKYCIRYGKPEWICKCGSNVWDDNKNTDRLCVNCGLYRLYWCKVDTQ